MNKKIIITGGNNGFGYHLVKSLLEMGNTVAALDLYTDNLTQLQSEKLLVITCDLTEQFQIDRSISTIIDKWDKIDCLINNACVATFSCFESKSLADMQNEFDVNYFGHIRLIKAVLPVMKNQGYGIIYNVSSSVGISGFERISGYASTKSALDTLTRTLNIELKEYNIKAKIIYPTLMNTKSAIPLGIPIQMLDDPKLIAEKISKKLFRKRFIVTPDFKTRFFIFYSRLFPSFTGKLLSRLTKKSVNQQPIVLH